MTRSFAKASVMLGQGLMPDPDAKKRRTRRVRIRQIGGDDGYQWCLIVDGACDTAE